jgi:hypothetical protein
VSEANLSLAKIRNTFEKEGHGEKPVTLLLTRPEI